VKKILPPLLVLIMVTLACGSPAPQPTPTPLNRLKTIPADHAKGMPADDPWPPVAAAPWTQPEQLPTPVSTAGAEDSAFITPDDTTLYFFFTPDVSIPVQKQLLDGVTGIWRSDRVGAAWTEPVRVLLESPQETALDGCEFVLDSQMWFCSAGQGNYRPIDFYIATLQDGEWTNWHNASRQLNETFQIGEMHLSADGQDLYFASPRPGGYGGSDLWVTHKNDDAWDEPINLGPQVNSAADENRPCLSADGRELWFDAPSRNGKPGPAVLMALLQADGTWGKPQEVISSFAGEPSLSGDGKRLYFIHHFYSADMKQMLEADIYVATRP